MKLFAYYDEEKPIYTNVSKTQYEAVVDDLQEKIRKELVESKKPLFYQLSPIYRKLQTVYEYFIDNL